MGPPWVTKAGVWVKARKGGWLVLGRPAGVGGGWGGCWREPLKVRALGMWLRGRNGPRVFVPCSGLLQWGG